MAHSSGQSIEDVATEGPGLVFIVYPAAIATMPGRMFWALIFFMMLLTLGLDSSVGEPPFLGNGPVFSAFLSIVRRLRGHYYCAERRVPENRTQPRNFRRRPVLSLLRGRPGQLHAGRILFLSITGSVRRRLFNSDSCSLRNDSSFMDLRNQSFL